jgi:very-short-patch-repair endonuclease
MDEQEEIPGIIRISVEEMMAHYDDPVWQRLGQLKDLSQELKREQWRERFALIREAYSLLMPRILERARYAKTISPYFIVWDFSPIEFNAWTQIRALALPFYPEVPVLGFFLDFADPYRKIGIELDGKDYHDAVKDAERDRKLNEAGWEIFRITGSMANRWMEDELPDHLRRVDEEGGTQDEEDERREWDDTLRRTTIDGFFKWLKEWFYSPYEIESAANPEPDEEE